MIKHLSVKNFKSIRELDVELKRINLFIGKPNSGKSNILESAGLFSFLYTNNLHQIIRFSNVSDLFFERDIRNSIIANIDKMSLSVNQNSYATLRYEKETICNIPFANYENGKIQIKNELAKEKLESIKFYKFIDIQQLNNSTPGSLLPPIGQNLSGTLLSNKDLRNLVNEVMSELNLKLVIKVPENQLEIQSETEGIVISFPFSTVSETLRRTIFYLAALKSNSKSTIILEEPEAHAFPYYSKLLSELISNNVENQFLITTHNPYFLLTMIEKTPKDDISVFAVSMVNGETKARVLSKEQLAEVLDFGVDLFFNVEKFTEEA